MGRSVGAGGVRAGVLAVLVLLLTAGCSSTPATVPAAAPTPPVPAAGRVTQKPTAPAAAASADPQASSSPRASSTPTSSSSSPTSSSSSGSFDLQRHSLDAPGSIWVVVDKRRPLDPKSWVPKDLVRPDVPHTNAPLLRKPAARALERLVAGAAEDGVHVVSLSAYRAYTTQKSIYDRNVRSIGKAATERLTARPGYSEHQTGLADDLGDGSGRCGIQTCFATTPAGRWLAANAWRYGFVQRYPKGLQAVTGIQWEPWHYRYVGAGLARHMHATGQPVLERVFGLPPSPDYR